MSLCLKFPGCLLNSTGCFLCSLLLSRMILVISSNYIPDNRQASKRKPQLTEKKNFNESGVSPFQKKVVEKESPGQILAPEDKISEILNAQSDDDAMSCERRRNILTEKNGNRVRRNPKYEVFDEEEIGNLTEFARQNCPHSTFCHSNRTEDVDFWVGYGSCCKDCFCDEQCGARMDCCWDYLDKKKIVETNKLTCITPVTQPSSERLENVPRYLMIDSCLGNSSYKCNREKAAVWGPLYPVSSSTSSMIYYNQHCAVCNGMTDLSPWDTYVSCNGTNSLSGLSLISGLKRKHCSVRFRPPKKATVEKFVCYPEVIRTCSLTERPFENNINMELLEKACRLTKAYVNAKKSQSGKIKKYENIFCKVCNGEFHYQNEHCKMNVDDMTKSSNFQKFTTFIDWGVFDSTTSDAADSTDTSEHRQIQKTCRENEVKHPTKEECRQLICPNGAIRTPGGCKLFAKTLYVPGFEIHVIMTPVSEQSIPLAEFSELIDSVPEIDDWLDTNGLHINHLIMYAEEETANDNTTFLGVLNMILGSNKYPLNVQQVLKAIEKALSKVWVITLDKTVYTYKVQFDKYETFVQTGSNARKKWFGRSSAPEPEPFMLPKVYTPVLYETKVVGPTINKLYFCEKVKLLEKEWSGAYDGLWLNVTGSGNGTFLGDGEFVYEKDFFGTNDAKVEICADDFLSQFVSPKNTAHSFGYNTYLFWFLDLVFIFA